MDNIYLDQPIANSEPSSSPENSPIKISLANLSKNPSNSSKQSIEQAFQSLAEENKKLQQQLAKSEQIRAAMAEENQHHESMLMQSLKEAEAYSAELAAAKAELTALNQQLSCRIESESAALSEATDSLQQAQEQAAHSEKFSTLGELVAGVAHEINNPISCITNNIKFVDSYMQQLVAHIALQQSVLSAPENTICSVDREDLEDHAEEIDLGYVTEDLPKLIESMATSGSRITMISQALRTFARADTALKQTYNLHQGIDGTLLILRHRLKAVGTRKAITIQKNYADIPTIQCYPGQINQVFMNVIANAIDAMEESTTPPASPRISIGTSMVDSQVVITIADNAGGMTDAVRDRIFERQFTTKQVGKGTGLGLSITRKIVAETHRGEISCQSKLGEGSSFRIALPVTEANN